MYIYFRIRISTLIKYNNCIYNRRREEKSKKQQQLQQQLQNNQKPSAYHRQESESISEREHPIPLQPINENQEVVDDDGDAKQGSYVCDPIWLLGLFLQVLGALLDFAALGYAPQSVVAPLGSLTLVVNVFVSPFMHDEKPSIKTIFATGIIICGAAITVAASPREDSVDSIQGVFDLYENSSFLIYAILTGGFITIGWCLTQYYVYLSRNRQRRYKKKFYKQHRFVIAAISGTMGAQNVLFAKSVSTLVVKSFQNGGRVLFGYWETYLLLAGLLSTIYFQLRWLNSGLKRFSALYVAPTFQAFWITVSVMGGLIVYKEFDDMYFWQKIVFPLGVILTIVGVFYLTTQGQPEKYKKTEENLKNHIQDHHDDNIVPPPVDDDEDDDELAIEMDKDKDNHDDDGIAISNAELAIDINMDQAGDDNNDITPKSGDSPIPKQKARDSPKPKQKPQLKARESGSKKGGSGKGTPIPNDDENKEEHGLMGFIKSMGDLGEASIVTGSSLGKLLLDPQGVYSNINVGANDEDIHYKGILSPQLSALSEEDTISSEKLIDEEEIKHIQETVTFLPQINDNNDINSIFGSKSKSKKKKRRRHSFNDHHSSHDQSDAHYTSDNANERYNDRRKRKVRRKKSKKRRSRSHSPPLTADEMAPHEVIFQKIGQLFTPDPSKRGQNKNRFNKNNDSEIETGYASMEKTPDINDIDKSSFDLNQSMAFPESDLMEIENDFAINESQSYVVNDNENINNNDNKKSSLLQD